MSLPIPIVLCIDVEPDPRRLDPKNPAPWEGFDRTYDFFRSLRSEIAQVTGSPAHYSWFFRMDPQVAQVYGSASWAVTRYPAVIQDLENQGDDLGLHVHHFRWDSKKGNWVIDYETPSWIEHCCLSSLAAYREALGRPCRSIRFGDAWFSQFAWSLLEKSGLRFDLSLEPGLEGYTGLRRNEEYSGAIPDLRGMPQRPYFPMISDFKKPDPDRREGTIFIPISRGEIFGWSALAYKCFRRVVNGIRPKKAWITLYLFQEPLLFRRVANQLLEGLELPYLALPLRTDASIRPYLIRNMKKNLKFLLTHPRVKDFFFSTPERAMVSLGIID